MTSTKIDILKGSLFKNIFIYSVPLIFSNVLQIFFNIVDVAVVGRFSGATQLGAVGSTTQPIFFFTGLIIGISYGVNALAAYYIGAKKEKDLNETIQTAFLFCIFSGIFLSAAGISIGKIILTLMHTKEEILPYATLYFRIYLLGLPFLSLFNFGNALLNAAGDTSHPLIYLSISGICNIILDLFFVIVLQMGVAGAALATFISQILSSVLILIPLFTGKFGIKIQLNNTKIYSNKLIQIIKIGVPAGLQSSIFAFANIFIQMSINSFDSSVVAGCTAADKVDALNYEIMGAFYSACATFISQNYGSGNKKRILNSYLVALTFSAAAGVIFGGIMLLNGPTFLSIFTKDQTVISAGMKRLSIMAVSYWMSSFMDCALAASRGLGKTIIPSVILILGSCIFRIVWIYTIFAYFQTIESLFSLYFVSWFITAVLENIYFFKIYRSVKTTD